MSEVTVPMDDKELMSAAMSDEPIAEAPAPEPVKDDSPPRDEHGRFAPKATEATPEPVAEQKPEPEKEQGIPSWRLK